MHGWKTTFLLGMPIFRCYVNFRAGSILPQHGIMPVTNASQPLVLAFVPERMSIKMVQVSRRRNDVEDVGMALVHGKPG